MRKLLVACVAVVVAGCAQGQGVKPVGTPMASDATTRAAATLAAGVGSHARVAEGQAKRDAVMPNALVVWVSVDGFRPDYLDGADAPFLKLMVKQGAYSRKLTPIYPSLTFAVHSAEVTGASAGTTGIPGNAFYDRELLKDFSFPPQPELLKAEPIWTTATRQGLRVAVMDWPFSQRQRGNYATKYFADSYDGKMTDTQRMQRMVDLLKYDDGKPPLALVMGYVDGVDKAGHQYGPTTRATAERVEEIDKLLAKVHAQAVETLKTRYPAGSKLYFMVSTDHGMAAVDHAANLKLMLGDSLPKDAKVITGGATGHVFLPEGPEKKAQLAAMMAALKPYPFARGFTYETLPPQWRLLDKNRVGDLYVDLGKGYTFSSRGRDAVVDMKASTSERGPLGMHSYDPATTPEMLGMISMSRWPGDFGGRDLGVVDARQLAATVAGWLRISPPPKAEVGPVEAVVR